MAQRRVKKARWPEDGILQFPMGMDSFHPDAKIQGSALKEATNVESPVLGAWQTRRGRTLFLTGPDPSTPFMGMYELVSVDGTTTLLLVQNGKLYRESSGSLVEIPIRRYAPYAPYPDDSSAGERLSGDPLQGAKVQTTGSVGPNLIANRLYRYACHGVDAAGTTELSAVTNAMKAQQGATARPVSVTFHGSYGMNSYVIWRSESPDGGTSWSAWGRMATALTHTTVGGKTLVQWSDSGAVTPDATVTPPATNTTVHTLPTEQRVDFETWEESWDGENAAYFINGDGFCRTDGTRAQIVPPTDPSTYREVSEAGPGINALADVAWLGHKARGLIRHHQNLFFGDILEAPNVFYFSRVLDPCHAPQIAAIPVPARGGRVLDFKVKDSQLGVAATTGIWTLLGTVFNPFFASDAYFSEALDIGVASEWSMVRNSLGLLQWVGNDRRLRGIAHLYADAERTKPIEVGEAIRPTLDELDDHANAVGLWAEDQWFIAYPGDQRVLRLYQRETADGLLTAPVMDTATALGGLFRRADGTILGAHATAGRIYKLLHPGTYKDAGVSYTCRIQTAKLDAGAPNREKKWRWMRVHYECFEQVTLHYRMETLDGILEGSVTLAGTGGYDEGMYDVATYDPWNAPFEEIDFGEEGSQLQVTLWWSGAFLRIYGLSFELDLKR